MVGVNLTFTEGGYLDRTTGLPISYNDWKYTDYIPITSMFKIITDTTKSSDYCVFCDKDKNVISYFNMKNFSYVPNRTEYIRLSCDSPSNILMYQVSDTTSKLNSVAQNAEDNIIWNRIFVGGTIANSGEVEQQPTSVNINNIPIDGSKKLEIDVPSGYKVGVILFNRNGDDITYIGWKPYEEGMVLYPFNQCNNIGIVVKHTDNSNISHLEEELKKITIKELPFNQSNTYLKFCTFNTGLWNDGKNRGVPSNKVKEKSIEWHKFLGNYNFDIIASEEAPKYFDSAETINAYGKILQFKYPFIGELIAVAIY